MKPIKINVSKSELFTANPNGYVDGRLIKSQIYYVYVELGKEGVYIPKDKDDKNTEYRIFFGCTIYYAKSEKERDAGEFIAEEAKKTVIIYG